MRSFQLLRAMLLCMLAMPLAGHADEAADAGRRLAEAATRFDVILTSGGASKGEEDHMVDALDALGTRHLWQLAVKPGRPMSFGQIGDTIMIGLLSRASGVRYCS